jgi:hypothetical protein
MTNFHQELQSYLSAKQGKNACKVVLDELAKCLINDRESFVAVLTNAGINAQPSESDIVLIEKFVQNAPTNKKLLLGASLLINYRNKVTNFDGEDEISDAGVKNTYKVLYHNVGGVGDLIKGAVDVGGKIYEKESAKQTQFSDAIKKRSEARQQMLQSVLNQKQAESTDKKSATNTKRKSKTTLIIVAGVLVGLTVIGFIIYKVRKNK